MSKYWHGFNFYYNVFLKWFDCVLIRFFLFYKVFSTFNSVIQPKPLLMTLEWIVLINTCLKMQIDGCVICYCLSTDQLLHFNILMKNLIIGIMKIKNLIMGQMKSIMRPDGLKIYVCNSKPKSIINYGIVS